MYLKYQWLHNWLLWRNRLARMTVNHEVGGSSPPGSESGYFLPNYNKTPSIFEGKYNQRPLISTIIPKSLHFSIFGIIADPLSIYSQSRSPYRVHTPNSPVPKWNATQKSRKSAKEPTPPSSKPGKTRRAPSWLSKRFESIRKKGPHRRPCEKSPLCVN